MGRCAGTDRVRPSSRMKTQWLLFWCRQSMPFWRATVCRSLICQSSWARRMAARSLVAVFMRHDTTGEIAARRELSSLVQILATSRRTTGLKVDRSITRKIASGCKGSHAGIQARQCGDRIAQQCRRSWQVARAFRVGWTSLRGGGLAAPGATASRRVCGIRTRIQRANCPKRHLELPT